MTAHEALEIELKYDLNAGASVPDLTVLEAVHSVTGPVVEHLDATYYDTDALDLAGNKITLRRREGGHDEGWHLKRPATSAGPGRREMQVGLETAADPFSEVLVPTELTDHVQVHVRGRRLSPIATISTVRRITELHDAAGEVLAVLCEDSVATQSLLPGGHAQTWNEWELELVAGDEKLLKAADKVLRSSGARTASSASKLARAIGPTPTGSDSTKQGKKSSAKKLSALELVISELAEHRDHLIAQDPLVRVDAPDSVHQMRVATRRARSVLRSFPEVLHGDVIGHLEGELKHLASILGDARDAEVQLERNRHLLEGESAPATIVAALIDDQIRTCGSTVEVVLEYLRSTRYYELLNELDSTVAEPQPGPDADLTAAKALDEAVARSAKRVRKAQRKLQGLAVESAEWIEQLHTIRKRAKQLRYTTDSADRLGTKKYSKIAKQAKQEQAALGDFHDAEVSREHLAQLAGGSGISVADAFVYGRLDAREQAAAETAMREYLKAKSRL
ncbi:CHAD domain-containing protein [Williamsia sp. 1138]|uniref:CYTH and CHAD domain-containing protein n=1 Tax=Williamsia sp. 1138 TaxID=1903117 RepID=UPI000A11559D|nr:CYTH and CHAD domain-containing protein [Williamsia sp. 1138]OZG30068.1 CHAD domain-containing protein [Williamsia sp. 1138]